MRFHQTVYIVEAIVVFFLITGCSNSLESSKDTDTIIRVSAASSLQDVMGEAETVFEKQHPEVDVVFNFGSSGSLKQQLSQGAPIDLYISASTDTVKALVEEGKLKEKNIANVLQNELVLIEPVDNDSNIEELQDITHENVEKIAIGTPESVPAGKYAKETLQQIDVYDEIKPKLIQAKNVRQVLTYVENQEVDAGFVYKTDALSSNKVNTIIDIKKDYHSPITYPAAITDRGETKKQAEVLFEFLQGEKVKEIVGKFGFKAQVQTR